MSVPLNFSLAVFGGLAANFSLMNLNKMHKGCANVCTLSQFLFGLSSALAKPKTRAALLSPSTRRMPLFPYHFIFSTMFFVGPYLGNLSVAVTNADFYPVFLVVRSCGSVTSMLLGYLFAGKRYTAQQVAAVVAITAGAGVTTLGCYQGGQAAKAASSAGGGGGGGSSFVETTPPSMFLFGLLLLLLNLLNDSGLGVLQSKVFAPYLAAEAEAKRKGQAPLGSVVAEAMAVMSGVGTLLMAAAAGGTVLGFFRGWVAEPTWVSLAPLPVSVPLELSLLVVNFVGNWNAKAICTWLNAHATAVLSALVPMFYRLLSTVLSSRLSGVTLPAYTWAGVALVFGGSLTYLLGKQPAGPPATSKKLA